MSRSKHKKKKNSQKQPLQNTPATEEKEGQEKTPAVPDAAPPAEAEAPADTALPKTPAATDTAAEKDAPSPAEAKDAPPVAEADAQSASAADTQAQPPQPKRRIWLYLLPAALLLCTCIAFVLFRLGVFAPAAVALIDQPFDQIVQAGGLSLSCPAEMEAIEGDSFVGAKARDCLIRYEDATEAKNAQLEAGYTPQESAQALLEAGYVLLTGNSDAPAANLTAEGIGSSLEFSLSGEDEKPLICRLSLLQLEDKDLISTLLCPEDSFSEAAALEKALRAALTTAP